MRTDLLGETADVADFEAIVRQYRPRVFRFALASLRDRDAAETVTQDCFLRAHAAWSAFRGDSSVHTWLMRIAVNLIRDTGKSQRFQFWRRAATGSVDLGAASEWLPDTGASPEQQAVARQRVKEVWKVVGNLSERQRTVFLLTFMEELTPAEIEQATGISRAAIKVHLFRAVHTIRERLGGIH
jgi:RNA polymerase sigma-70 factor (ECF subfamily)